MSPAPYRNPSWSESLSAAISRNFPKWTVTISKAISGIFLSLWKFLVEMFHDAIGR